MSCGGCQGYNSKAFERTPEYQGGGGGLSRILNHTAFRFHFYFSILFTSIAFSKLKPPARAIHSTAPHQYPHDSVHETTWSFWRPLRVRPTNAPRPHSPECVLCPVYVRKKEWCWEDKCPSACSRFIFKHAWTNKHAWDISAKGKKKGGLFNFLGCAIYIYKYFNAPSHRIPLTYSKSHVTGSGIWSFQRSAHHVKYMEVSAVTRTFLCGAATRRGLVHL